LGQANFIVLGEHLWANLLIFLFAHEQKVGHFDRSRRASLIRQANLWPPSMTSQIVSTRHVGTFDGKPRASGHASRLQS
jgi:hypothetical protein